nr:MAG TPA: hypothetical protein [Caudoviricetes sp.]
MRSIEITQHTHIFLASAVGFYNLPLIFCPILS